MELHALAVGVGRPARGSATRRDDPIMLLTCGNVAEDRGFDPPRQL